MNRVRVEVMDRVRVEVIDRVRVEVIGIVLGDGQGLRLYRIGLRLSRVMVRL